MSLIAAGALSACGGKGDEKAPCFDLTAPGVVVYLPGLDVLVRDVYGRGQALGTKVTVYHGVDSLVSTWGDTLHVHAGFNFAGTFTVRASRPYYRDAVISNVVVVDGQCSVAVTHLPVTLQLAPGAPPVRSLTILGGGFFFLSKTGDQLSLTVRFDADPCVATTVNCRLSNTTLVRIDNAGVVTAKCSLTGGVETVTATATADTTVHATAKVSVQKQTSCA